MCLCNIFHYRRWDVLLCPCELNLAMMTLGSRPNLNVIFKYASWFGVVFCFVVSL
jgi:hypothetical protein